MPQLRYSTPNGITVTRTDTKLAFSRGLGHILKQLDSKRGAYFSSGYEYPERYSRWDVATLAPPLEIVGRERTLAINALNDRGRILLKFLDPLLCVRTIIGLAKIPRPIPSRSNSSRWPIVFQRKNAANSLRRFPSFACWCRSFAIPPMRA